MVNMKFLVVCVPLIGMLNEGSITAHSMCSSNMEEVSMGKNDYAESGLGCTSTELIQCSMLCPCPLSHHDSLVSPDPSAAPHSPDGWNGGVSVSVVDITVLVPCP